MQPNIEKDSIFEEEGFCHYISYKILGLTLTQQYFYFYLHFFNQIILFESAEPDILRASDISPELFHLL